MTVIGAAIAVLRDGSTELRHRQHDDVGHAIAEILGEGGERRAEIVQARGELTLLGALAHVRVPTVGVSERDFEPDVGADQLGDLPQRLAQARPGILGVVRGRQPAGVGSLQHANGLERLASGAVQQIVHALRIERLESLARGRRLARCAHVEAVERRERDRAGVATQGAGQGGAERDGAEGRGRRGLRDRRAREPAVGRGLHARRAGLHVVLRVEVRACGVGRAARVNDRERP